ncbi:hypothetical protein [Micromonospora sp. CPCC 205556]|uniref:hypothetical protein n=1 Tax=Micromonospora sp. CPCC 205556 TaxID=3122398 RepID=UPI002FF36D8A
MPEQLGDQYDVGAGAQHVGGMTRPSQSIRYTTIDPAGVVTSPAVLRTPVIRSDFPT